jgi:single-strand DNA-binding protein
MNIISITGRLAADPELRFAPSGTAICNFTVASDVGFGDKKTTNWFKCAIFGKRAEGVAPHLKKGQEVTVFGSLTLREYTNRDGIKATSPDVDVSEIALMGGKGKQEAAPARQDGADSIPF